MGWQLLGTCLLSCLKTGTLAQSQSLGKVPEPINLLNRKERDEAISSAQHLSKYAGIRSGPQDLFTS